jgi:hypothetical protein
MTSNTVNLTDLKIGDIVTIYFYPYSQKYLDMLTPKKGTIVATGNNNFDYRIKMEETTEYLLHEGVSYYGDTLGYDYTIYRN